MVVTGKNLNESLQDLTGHVKMLATVTANLVSAARTSAEQVGQVSKDAATAVSDIVRCAKVTINSDLGPSAPREFTELSKTINASTKSLIESSGDSQKVLANARTIANATAQLVAAAKKEAATLPAGDRQNALLKSAQNIAGATANLAKAAKGVQSNTPGN